MGIGAVAADSGDDGGVVLKIVGQTILAFAPLDHIHIITNAHDGSPISMALIIRGAIGLAIVTEIEGVSGLVAGGLGGVFGIAVAELGGEDEAWGIGIPREGIQISHPAGTGAIPIVAATANADADSELGIGGGCFA